MLAAQLTEPTSGPLKTYDVQIDRLPDSALLEAIERGVEADGEHLGVRSVRCLRTGKRNAWLKVVLDEGRNRQLRRLLASLDVSVLRLVRVAIGPLNLGLLANGEWRRLTNDEVDSLSGRLTPRSLRPCLIRGSLCRFATARIARLCGGQIRAHAMKLARLRGCCAGRG